MSAVIQFGVPFAEYLKIDAVNWSSLKLMGESARAYRWNLDHRQDDTDTPSRKLGRATHTLALDPGQFAAQYAVFDGDRRAGPAWTAFEKANAGRDILKESEIETARRIAASVQECRLLDAYRVGAQYEVTITWTDPATGLRCKARPDWLPGDPEALIDLKTTRTINARRFTSQAEEYSYFAQLAHYRNGLRALGRSVSKVLIAAVESKPPFDVGVFALSDMAIDSAAGEVAELMGTLADCLKTNRWPGRYDSEQALCRPEWALGGDLSFTPDED